MKQSQEHKFKLLRQGVIYDLIGMVSMTIPFLGPFTDILWAPFAAKKMRDMYPGRDGKIAAVFVFLEEILPYTDIIPSFTLMWLYTFIWKSQTSEHIVIK